MKKKKITGFIKEMQGEFTGFLDKFKSKFPQNVQIMSETKKKITGFVKNIQSRFYGIVDEIRLLKVKRGNDCFDAIELKKDSNKVKALQYYDEFDDRRRIMAHINEYDSIVKGLQNFTEDEKEELIWIAEKVDDDVKKLELFNSINSNGMIRSLAINLKIFKEISSECERSLYEEKEQAISSKEEVLRESLVKTTTSEINAEETFNNLQKKIEFAKDAMNLPTDEEKINSISNISSEYLKSKVIGTLENEDKKIEYISLLKDDIPKLNVVVSLSDEKKIKYLDLFKAEDQLSIITSIQDDNIKLDNFLIFKDKIDYLIYVAETLKEDENKIKAIKVISDIYPDNKLSIEQIMLTLSTDEKILEYIDKAELQNTVYSLIRNIKDSDLKIDVAKKYLDISYMESFLEEYEENYKDDPRFKEIEKLTKGICKLIKWNNDYEKADTIEKMDNENLKLNIALSIKSDKIKSDIIDCFFDENKKLKIARNIEDKKSKIEAMKKISPENIKILRKHESIDFVKENLNLFLELEGFKEKIPEGILEELFEKNNEVICEIDFRLLGEKYINKLGKDKVNLISNFNDIQEKILNLPDKEFDIFSKCINNYTKNNDTDEWTVIADEILDSLRDKQYTDLIGNIEIENISEDNLNKLIKIIQDDNNFDIKTLKELENFEEIKRKKCDEMINSNIDVNHKKNYLMQKTFGHDIKYAKKIIDKYGDSIDKIGDQELKNYVEALRMISETENEEVLKEIYENVDEIEFFADKVEFERELKTEYCKLYKEGLFDPNNSQKLNKEELKEIGGRQDLSKELEGMNVYNAGTEFRMLITSVSAYTVVEKIDNYNEDWNRLAVGSQHFCASYIGEDMMGCAPINHVVYGFSDIKDDSLMLSGPKDIHSTGESFVSKAWYEKYYDNDTQINETVRHNEMDIRRIQGGEKKQPDYIIAFKAGNKIKNLDKIQQAYNDWEEKLPIVIVDVDECLRQQGKEINNMMTEYEQTEDIVEKTRLGKEITQKVKNNKNTIESFKNGKNFYNEIGKNKQSIEKQLRRIKEEYEKNKDLLINKERKIGEEVLEDNYNSLTPEDRKGTMNQLKSIISKIIEEKAVEER